MIGSTFCNMNQNKQIVIIGAGGHGRVAAEIARKTGYSRIVFLDDADIPGVAGKTKDFIQYLHDAAFFVAIGNSKIRQQIQKMLQDNDAEVTTLIHPNAVISDNVAIGSGTVIMAGAVVNTGAVLGDGVIVNTCASVDHDCTIGDYVHVAVGAHVCGTVDIGSHTWIGAGATVVNNVSVIEGCAIGAGAVIIDSIDEKGTYVGVPGKKVEKHID